MRFLLDRREWLSLNTLGVLSTLGTKSFAETVKSSGKRSPGFDRAKSVLIVFTSGGMSQLESWDPKPNAPVEIRGAFNSIPTDVSGLRISEHLPLMAKRMKHLAVIRSMTHDDTDHGSATYYALTGQFHARKSSNPAVSPNDYPCLGSVLQKVRPFTQFPHGSIHLNGPMIAPIQPAAGQNGGFLGRGFDPLVLGNVQERSALLAGLEEQPELSAIRLESRRSLLNQIEQSQRQLGSESSGSLGTLSSQAYELLQSKGYCKAFDLEAEPQKVRERYGDYRSGQACLLARRLIEAGIPLITVFCNHNIRGQDRSTNPDDIGWDTHNDIFKTMKTNLLPRFDKSFSALMDDLHERRLLHQTLVICMGEFGRAPLVAKERTFAGETPGRKHWAACYSILMGGAGITPGQIYGASDRSGAYPQSHPVRPPDVIATIFAALGIDPKQHYEDATNRPFPITTGEPILGLYR